MNEKNYYYFTHGHLLLTEKCNLMCDYCYHKEKRERVMSTEVGLNSVDFLINGAKKSGEDNFAITFFGGEPTLNIPLMNEVFDYAIKRANEENLIVKFTLITNGMIFNQSVQKFILKWKKTLGSITVQLSFDGNPEQESINRPLKNPKEGYTSGMLMDRNLEIIKEFCIENGIEIGKEIFVHSVIPKAALPSLFDNYKYFVDKGFMGMWHILLLEDNWEESDVEIYREQMEKMYEFIINSDNLEFFAKNKVFHRKDCQSSLSCSAGRILCTIDADGYIFPCHRYYTSFPDDNMGQILSDGSVIIDTEKKEFFDNLRHYDFSGQTACRDCHITNCFRCPAGNKESSGFSVLCPSKYCKMAQVEYDMQNKISEFFDKLIEENPDDKMIKNIAIKQDDKKERAAMGERNKCDCNNISTEVLSDLITSINELKSVLAYGFTKMEERQNDMLSMFIAIITKMQGDDSE